MTWGWMHHDHLMLFTAIDPSWARPLPPLMLLLLSVEQDRAPAMDAVGAWHAAGADTNVGVGCDMRPREPVPAPAVGEFATSAEPLSKLVGSAMAGARLQGATVACGTSGLRLPEAMTWLPGDCLYALAAGLHCLGFGAAA